MFGFHGYRRIAKTTKRCIKNSMLMISDVIYSRFYQIAYVFCIFPRVIFEFEVGIIKVVVLS